LACTEKKKKMGEEYKKLNATNVPVRSSALMVDEADWNIFKNPKNIAELNAGKTIFSFACRVGHELTEHDKRLIGTMVNVSCFEDEEKENNVPVIDVTDEEQVGQFTVVITRTAYLIPGVSLSQFEAMKQLICIPQYHKLCQPGSPVIADDCPQPDTIRMTKTIIPYVFKITLQLKSSELTMEQMNPIAAIDGFPGQRALLMERTKRNTKQVDSTRKVKSVLVYNDVPGGILVRHSVAVYNTMIPSYGARVLNNLGSFGSTEAYQTAQMTRHALPQLLAGKTDIKTFSDGHSGWFS